MPAVLPAKPFALMVRIMISCLVVLVWWYAAKSQDPARSDATGDWILVKAVSGGLSPFEDARVLGERLGVSYQSILKTDEPIVAYRTPGAILLLYPLIVFDWWDAHLLLGLVGLLCFLWMLLVQVPRYCQMPTERMLLPLALASVSAAFIESTFWGALSALVSVLTIASILRASQQSAGIPLAAATVLKLYPGLLFVPMLIKRQRSLRVGLTAILGMTALGAIAFHLSLLETIRLLLEGSRVWLGFGDNVSVAGMLTGASPPAWIFPMVVVVGIVTVGSYAKRRPLEQSLALAIPVSLLVNPVSWGHYGVVLIPLVLWLWTKPAYRFGRYTAIIWLVFQAIASTLAKAGAIDVFRVGLFGTTLLVAGAIAFAPAAFWKTPEQVRPLQLTA